MRGAQLWVVARCLGATNRVVKVTRLIHEELRYSLWQNGMCTRLSIMLIMSREFLATFTFIVLMSSEGKTCHQDLRR